MHYHNSVTIDGYEPHGKIHGELPDCVTILKERPLNKKYDLITLFHVFEHIENLDEVLQYVKTVLSDEGHVLIEVPYPMRGAFDLVIADHIWHFTKKSLIAVLNKAGFTTVYIGNEVIEKELTVLARIGEPVAVPDIDESSTDAINWLLRYDHALKKIEGKFAIYGTGPAAAWTGAVLGDKVSCYVDDDMARVGSHFNGKPILLPQYNTLPVIAPFPDHQLQQIRIKNKGMNIISL